MNILSLVLALVLILSVLMIERLDKFKNQMIIQKQYQAFLTDSERKMYNQRQKALFKDYQKSLRLLSFRYLLDKDARKKEANASKQYRLLIEDLMKNLYGKAAFFKEISAKRSNFIDELLTAIQEAADTAPENTIKDTSDIARLDLKDADLQRAFYLMLKGSVSREEFKKMEEGTSEIHEKAYTSLLNYINFDGKKAVPRIVIQRAPREILKTIFLKDDIVESIIARRNELAKKKDEGSKNIFESEFKDKRRSDIDDQLLDFSISSSSKSEYD